MRHAPLGITVGLQWPHGRLPPPRTPCLFVLNASITKVPAASSLSMAVVVSNTVWPTLKVTYDRQNGELSDLVSAYSPGLRRKKKAIMTMYVTACSSWPLEAAAMHASRRRT